MFLSIRENTIEDKAVLSVLKEIAMLLQDIEIHSISSGTGTPESVVTAPIGSLFLRTDGGASTTLYVKESGAGNTGWIAK